MSSEPSPPDQAPTSRSSRFGGLAAYLDRRPLVMLGLGFASGLPNLLIFDTLSAWLRDSGLSLKLISFFSLATLAYSFKFLWAPVIDRAALPGLTAWLGKRRAWMLVDAMNRRWPAPLVTTAVGGKRGGGTKITELGQLVLRSYRDLQVQAEHLLDRASRGFAHLF